MSDFGKALQIAYSAHFGSVDKQQEPYILHPIRVAEKLADPTDRVIAILHDVLEDSDWSSDDLRKIFGDEVADTVVTLTRLNHEKYDAYIERLRQTTNYRAIRVKLADLADNLDESRGPIPERLAQRYRCAAQSLNPTTRQFP